jgi:hypothetical protein
MTHSGPRCRPRPPRLYTILVLAMAGTLAAATAAAQQPATGTIRGRVLDPQKQGVPAVVRVVQTQTGLERQIQADPSGRFALTNLAPGELDLFVEAPGFAPRRLDGLALEVGRVLDVEIALQLSALEERVTVAGAAGAVDVVGSDVGAVISAREIASLPLNGRNFLELAFLVPGNAPAPSFDPTKAQSVIVSSVGGLGRGGNITIDGMDDNDDVVGGPLKNVAQDSVQEFQLATSRFSAEHGRSAGSPRARRDVRHARLRPDLGRLHVPRACRTGGEIG